MKTFIIGCVLLAATFLPIMFIPLLVLAVLISMAFSPYFMKNGFGIWNNDEHTLNSSGH